MSWIGISVWAVLALIAKGYTQMLSFEVCLRGTGLRRE